MSSTPAPSAFEEDEVVLRSADQTSLVVRRVRAQGAARGRLAFVHGFAEHGRRYLPTMRWFAERGLDCTVLDLRGHGRSGGRRTFVRRWGEYLEDVEAYLRHVEVERPGTPLFPVGHSMGGLVVARALQDRLPLLPRLAGAVVLSPFLQVKMKLPGWKVAAGNVLSRWLPWFRMPTDLDPSHLSRDPAVGAAYMADPLISHSATTRWYTEAMDAQRAAFAATGALSLPLLVMHGEDDGIVDIEGTRRWFDLLSAASDKALVTWPGGRHELLNETDQDAVRARILAWLEPRLGGAPARASASASGSRPAGAAR